MEMEASSSPYLYGHPSSDFMHIDDLLDFSNQDIFFDSSSDGSSSHHYIPPVESSSSSGIRPVAGISDSNPVCNSFSDDLCVPCDDVAQLEWLSQFVEDSFSDVPFPGDSSYFAGTAASGREASAPGRARSKRSRAAALGNRWVSLPSTEESDMHSPGGFFSDSGKGKGGGRRKETVIGDGGVRKCTHCATEKTPQWRTGPLGPKSLCNACGVRYKSGRLVPEYRPAASPTFVLTQHSNSHRKVMELRRQKELTLRQGNFPDFKVC